MQEEEEEEGEEEATTESNGAPLFQAFASVYSNCRNVNTTERASSYVDALGST
jgi:hypothetical protein